jgi:hypothetical protein
MLRHTTVSAALVIAFGALAATSAAAEERVCTGTIGAIALDNVYVPDGASCLLKSTRLTGSIVVGSRANLTARSVSVNGNVQAEGAQNVIVEGRSMIGGSVQAVQGYSVTIKNATVAGNVLVDENTGPVLASRNRVGADMQFFKNTGGAHIVENVLKGNLQCKENSPPPTGFGNRAASKEDQCANL